MYRRSLAAVLTIFMLLNLSACSAETTMDSSMDHSVLSKEYESAEGRQVKMLPLELTLIERNNFAKGMRLPRMLSTEEETTRKYEIGDFGYWDAGPDLAIFYDDIYEQTIVPVIPLGKAETGAENMRYTSGTVRLELVPEESEETQNE